MSTRELRFWPLLFGVYALVWSLEALVTRLRGMPVVVSFDVTATDLAIFGIVFGVWLVAFALRKQESNETATNVVAI